MSSLTHLDLFSGIGSARKAASQSSIDLRTLARYEISEKADVFYRKIWGVDKSLNRGNVMDQDYSEFENVDMLTAGFECQPFSRMGSKKGVNDPRFTVGWVGISKALQQAKPKYFLLENVVGFPINDFVTDFDELGYTINWYIDCPHNYGATQTRKRLFILGTRKGLTEWTDKAFWGGNTEVNKVTFCIDQFKPEKNPDPTGYYKINPKRVEKVFDPNIGKVGCITKMGHDSHCRRMTWIKHKDGFRGYTLKELFVLFGWRNFSLFPLEKRGLSKSAMYMGFGNSWHVGHASLYFRALPPHDLVDY